MLPLPCTWNKKVGMIPTLSLDTTSHDILSLTLSEQEGRYDTNAIDETQLAVKTTY